jgi:hypothetical protein
VQIFVGEEVEVGERQVVDAATPVRSRRAVPARVGRRQSAHARAQVGDDGLHRERATAPMEDQRRPPSASLSQRERRVGRTVDSALGGHR